MSTDRTPLSAPSSPSDAERFDGLFAGVRPILYRIARSRLHNADDAWEAVQDTALRAWRRFDVYDPSTGEDGFRRWVTQIMLWLCSNEVRKCHRLYEQDMDFWDSADAVPVSRPEESLSAALDDEMKFALLSINPRQRAVLLLVALGNFSYEDAATALHIPVGTVMSRLCRARRILRERLRHYARTEKNIQAVGLAKTPKSA